MKIKVKKSVVERVRKEKGIIEFIVKGETVLIDKEDLDLVQGYTWRIIKGYALTHIPNPEKKGYKNITMHRMVLEKKLGRKLNGKEVCHHLNEDSLDNTASNIIVCANGSEHNKYHKQGEKNPNYGKFGKDHPAFGKTWNLTEKTKSKISLSKMGKLNPQYGQTGEQCCNSKLKEKDVIEILKAKGKQPVKVLAEVYNISDYTIKDIFAQRTWKHVTI